MRKRSLVCLFAIFVLCTGAMANTVDVNFFDENGALLTNVNVVFAAGPTMSKLAPQTNGVYTIPAAEGSKVSFQVTGENASYVPTDVVIPVDLQGPLAVVVQTSGAGGSSCDTATAIAPGETLSGDTSIDGSPDDPGFCGTSITAPGVWFSVEGTGETLTASTCNQAAYDTKINIYCLDCEDLVCVDGNDDGSGCSGFSSEISWCSEVGASYGVFVQGFGGETGAFDLTLSGAGDSCSVGSGVSCLPPPPVGACCNCLSAPFNCTVGSIDECLALGGDFQGDGAQCSIIPFANTDIQAIPDGQFPTYVSKSLTVSGGPAGITDVNVGVVYTHTWIGDLNFDVENPGGTRITLWPSICDAGQFQGIDTEFDDEGTAAFCNATGPTPAANDGNGNIIPLGGTPLSVYDGTDSNGTWTLYSADDFLADTGTNDLFYVRFNNEAFPNICEEVVGDDDDFFTTLCHCPPGLAGGNCHTITVGGNAGDAHLNNHGYDYLGECTNNTANTSELTSEGQQAGGTIGVGVNSGATTATPERTLRQRVR